jgi:hypothetical protein
MADLITTDTTAIAAELATAERARDYRAKAPGGVARAIAELHRRTGADHLDADQRLSATQSWG